MNAATPTGGAPTVDVVDVAGRALTVDVVEVAGRAPTVDVADVAGRLPLLGADDRVESVESAGCPGPRSVGPGAR